MKQYKTIAGITFGVMTDARQSEAAKALIDFLTTPTAVNAFKAKGLEP